MSQAGARSDRGDEYQLRIAMRWLVRLWTDPDVVAVQAESLGMPDDDDVPLVDDVVVELEDGRRIYIQAKKNHPNFGTWSLRTPGLLPELKKARDHLERGEPGGTSVVRFVSRSPFGALHKLAEGSRDYPVAATFSADAPNTLKSELEKLANQWDRSLEEAFALVRRMEFTVTGDYDDLDRDLLAKLRMMFARPEDVRDLLEERLHAHQARLRDPVKVFRRADLERVLAERGHFPSPDRAEADQLAAFARSSKIGRSWVRDVADEAVERSETQDVLDAIEDGARTILVTGEPGIGKTCVLLDVADALESDPSRALLFIKGDRYSGAQTDSGLVERGLPDDIVGRCARLAVHRPVVVVLDALDVLSLQRVGGTLRLFLSLIDRLAVIDGVTVIAACRTFDLEFDPSLRGRSWDKRVTVGLLDVDRGVAPVLKRWGVEPARLDPDLIKLLRVPARLWLYGKILGDAPVERVASVYELHNRYLDSVEKESDWGADASAVLGRVARLMQETRTVEVSRAEMAASADVEHGLLSRGVLVETGRGYAFGHQELLDVVAVRAAQRRGERLRDFVAARPALPFLRPTVRVFLHVLRSQNPVAFRRDVWAFLSDAGISYHLKRLVAETLAEFAPEAEDDSLLCRLMRNHGDLFERFLQRAIADAWLDTVADKLLPSARQSEDADRWTNRLLRHLAVWVTARPDVVLSIWRRALDEAWPGAADLTRRVAYELAKSLLEADRERVPWADAEWLIRRLLRDPPFEGQEYAIGRAVVAWVEAGGSDDVLLDFLALKATAGASRDGLDKRIWSLRGETRALSAEKFLTARMAASDVVIDGVMAYVLREAVDEKGRYLRGILGETSWQARHGRRRARFSRWPVAHDAANPLLGALEDAFAKRAARGDTWWQEQEHALVTHQDPGVRYLALQAYRCKPEIHIEAISALLTDPATYDCEDLESEIRELANAVYRDLGAKVMEDHQALVLSLGETPSTGAENWMIQAHRCKAYGHLVWVPRMYRTPEAEAFVNTWEAEFGPYRPEPKIYSSGGLVEAPVSAEQIQGLSDVGVLRVIDFWGTTVNKDFGSLIGGWDQLVHSVRDAAMNVPARALGWLDALLEADAPDPYPNACVGGISTHLQKRFGGLIPSGTWAPVEPLPDGPTLGRALLRLLERYGKSWIKEYTLVEAVQACVYVLDDDESAARLTLLLVRLGRSASLAGSFDSDPMIEALNSTRGKATIAAIELAVRVAEAGRDLPELLPPLLRQFACDERPSVRWAILRHLPTLTQSEPNLAWELFSEAMAEAGSAEWEVAERSLYYNYRPHFERVGPILDRIRTTALDVAGPVFGRIGTLSVLSGHLDEETLFAVLLNDQPSVWAGVAGVFAANLSNAELRARCEEGLIRLLMMPGVPDSAMEEVAWSLAEDETRTHVSRRVMEALLQGPPDQEEYGDRVHSVLKWASEKAGDDALAILSVLERLADGLEDGRFRGLDDGHDLVAALTAVLREADETDDPALIARVVTLQDRLLRLNATELDRMLDEASRP